MPHWDMVGSVFNSLQSALANAVAPERTFRPQDVGQLVAIGRAIGNLSRITWDDPEFQAQLNETRTQLSNQVAAVFSEAEQEAGREPVNPELLAALTEALALAAGDPRPWSSG